jgi:hypothetical protein
MVAQMNVSANTDIPLEPLPPENTKAGSHSAHEYSDSNDCVHPRSGADLTRSSRLNPSDKRSPSAIEVAR